ncbi:MAG: hypothetical protein Q9227_009002 [Pyrenula ochraceoflavens]
MSFIFSLFLLVTLAAEALTATLDSCKIVANSSDWPSISDWQNLNASVSGRLIAASSPGAVCHPGQPTFNNVSCAAVRSQWLDYAFHASNPFTTDYNDDTCLPDATAPCSSAGYPAYAIEAVDVADIQSGVRFAAKTGVRLIVKGTGHDYPGRSKGPGALEIWTHRLTGLTLSASKRAINGLQSIGALKIAAGMQWGEIYTYAAQHNFTVIGGANLNVGVGGWALGGGHGPVTNVFGMGADQILELEVVTADGEYRVVNEASYPDLFWALRGGGGSTFAVMLSVTVKIYPSIPGTSVSFSYSTTAASDTYWSLAARFHTYLPSLSEAGASGYFYLYPQTSNPDPSVAGTMSGIFIFPQKTRQQAAQLLTPLQRDLNGSSWAVDPIHASSTPRDFDDFSSFWLTNPPEEVGFDGRLGSWLLDGAALNTSLSSLQTQLRKSTPPTANLISHLVAGPGVRNAQIPGGSNAVLPAWRKTCIHVGRIWSYLDFAEKATVTTELRESGMPALKQIAPRMGAYLSESDPTNPNWIQDYYGSNYPRLLAIKKQWDPNGVFWCKPCVGNELWDVVDGPSNESKLEWGVGQTPEFAGTLLGFDDYIWFLRMSRSCHDYTGAQVKLPKILLNGNNICMLIPGGEGPTTT